MPLETGTYINDLVSSNPAGSDDASLGDNHLRLTKGVLKNTFPGASKAFRFPVTASEATSTVNVSFPGDQNKTFPVSASGGAVSVSLPDPTSGGTVHEDGFHLTVVKVDSSANFVNIVASGGQTINGASSISLLAQWAQAVLVWSKFAAKWFALTPNQLAALAVGPISVAATGAVTLSLDRTENDTTEASHVVLQRGSGVGNTYSLRTLGGAANDVTTVLEYIGSTELRRITTALETLNIPQKLAQYTDVVEIGTPASPAADVVRMFASNKKLWSKNEDGLVSQLSGVLLDRAYTESTAVFTSSTVIPLDDTIPQNTEGAEFLTLSITPKSATSRVRVRFKCDASVSVAATSVLAAIFTDSNAAALAATRHSDDGEGGFGRVLCLEFEHVPGAAVEITYKVRVGPSAAATVTINGSGGSRIFGGVSKATLILEELAV